jgi:hypothetical protein
MIQKVIPGFNRLTPEGQEAVRTQFSTGIAYQQLQKLAGIPDEAEKIVALFKNPNMRTLTERAFPDPQEFAAFEQHFGKVLKRIMDDQVKLGNPHAIDALKSTDTLGRLTPWSMAQALGGAPLLAVAQGLGAVEAGALKAAQLASKEHLTRIAATRVNARGQVTPEFRQLVDQLAGNPSKLAALLKRPAVQGAYRGGRSALLGLLQAPEPSHRAPRTP